MDEDSAMFELKIEEHFVVIVYTTFHIFVHSEPHMTVIKECDMGKKVTIFIRNGCCIEQSHTLTTADNGHARVNELSNNITAAITFIELCSHKQSVLPMQKQKASHTRHEGKKRLSTE